MLELVPIIPIECHVHDMQLWTSSRRGRLRRRSCGTDGGVMLLGVSPGINRLDVLSNNGSMLGDLGILRSPKFDYLPRGQILEALGTLEVSTRIYIAS